MASRPLVSYDDITLPYDNLDVHRPQPSLSKRRKKSNGKSTSSSVHPPRHWDDPGTSAFSSTIEETAKIKNKSIIEPTNRAMDDEEESRELTHEEIWDDTALVDAWNAAMEEYEAFNGTDKGWKSEPVFKSPLWYNVPPSTKPPSSFTSAQDVNHINNHPAHLKTKTDHDSHSIDLEASAPIQNPGRQEAQQPGHLLGAQTNLMVSQDDAFSRALNAMYWGGYWTAVYHCHRNLASTRQAGDEAVEETAYEEMEDEGEEGEGIADGESELYISTQR